MVQTGQMLCPFFCYHLFYLSLPQPHELFFLADFVACVYPVKHKQNNMNILINTEFIHLSDIVNSMVADGLTI